MKRTPLEIGALAIETYDPERLLQWLKERLNLKRDKELAKLAGFPASAVSRVRNRRLGLTSGMILGIHEATDIPIAEIKEAAGLPAVPRVIDGTRYNNDVITTPRKRQVEDGNGN